MASRCGFEDASIPKPNLFEIRRQCTDIDTKVMDLTTGNCSSVRTEGSECSPFIDYEYLNLLGVGDAETLAGTRFDDSSWVSGPISWRQNYSSYLAAAKSKIRYRLSVIVPSTCYMKLWMGWEWLSDRSVIANEFTLEPTFSGPGGRCFSDSDLVVNILPWLPRIPWQSFPSSSEWFEADLPVYSNAFDGEPTNLEELDVQKFSYVPGYEPDISDPSNPQPNGYPDPTWEAAAP